MRHRISVGALVVRDEKLLLLRHCVPGDYDFWAPPGGGVEGAEELAAAVERETLEETGIVVEAGQMVYVDELIDHNGRMVKFWHLATYRDGEIDLTVNPVPEAITDAGWFARDAFPTGYVFPRALLTEFWDELARGGAGWPRKLPLLTSLFDS